MSLMGDPINKTNLILDTITNRQQALGSNISNVNTPGYLRRDLDFSQVLGALNSPLETKLSQKLGPSPFVFQESGEVNISEEMIEMQKNMLFYTMATRRMSSLIQEVKTVTQVGK